MRLQEFMIKDTRQAMEGAFRYAKVVPEDKRDWKPLDTGRSVLDLARELAMCPDWASQLFDPAIAEAATHEAEANEMASWQSVEACEVACYKKLDRYFDVIANFPDDKLSETSELPFGPGGTMQTFTMEELMDYPRWNAAYHQGQIAYIQTLYGDKSLY